MSPAENTRDILVIYEQEAEEWALYLKSLFGLIVNKEGILLYDLGNSSFKHQELLCLLSYKCKLLILSCGLLNCLNQKRSYFLEQVLKPQDNVVILLCGVENSEILYEILTLAGGSKEISTDQKPEEYISVVKEIIQPDKPWDESPGDSVSYIYEVVLVDDHHTISDINLSDVRGASEETDFTFKTEELCERLESNEQSILVLPRRISCENPGEIFILLKEEIDEETLEIEFITDNQQIRMQTASWNKKVKYVKALDFPAGPVYVNVYCGGVIKRTAQIEYYTALEEIEPILKKVADPIAFTCQALKFSSVEKVDDVLTSLLKNKISTYEFSLLQSEGEHHHQANNHLEEFPTLLHCAARFGLKKLAAFLLSCPEATRACKVTNKYGDDPESIAKKHGHEELRKLIKELSSCAASDFTNCKEEVEDSDTYELMLGSEAPPAVAKQNSRDQYAVGLRCQQEVEVDEEKKDDLKDSREETEDEDEEEDSYSHHNSPGSLYVNVRDELKESRRDCFFCKRPPCPPPRNLPGIQRQDNLQNSSQERREQGDGLTTACCGEDQGSCEEDSEEEHPYTCVAQDEGVYDLILGQEEQVEEKRKHCRSFIMNRPPAPAPRPVCSLAREENTPYIVQEAHRGHIETVTYSTMVHKISPEQEELIHLQKQVKKGATSIDEALDRFKQWQNKKERPPSTQLEKVHPLRETIRNRQENENLNVYN
ncbi:B-cell scaffold protein with ankyrin repeats isoform X2 [Haemorhous mexicanus]|uniref:B-cell scaffold protein with ankyrin repeats isoform X2 n=1 Tax=Haemorhous mexicanus TaxID=30427 RepID=UPI0028BD3D5C|nr:B-cell scaffold protein with ankyrin repeats isoform X2 [Haemorhous mexicanus]